MDFLNCDHLTYNNVKEMLARSSAVYKRYCIERYNKSKFCSNFNPESATNYISNTINLKILLNVTYQFLKF